VDEFSAIPKIKGEALSLPDSVRVSVREAMECASEGETRLILNSAYLDVSYLLLQAYPDCGLANFYFTPQALVSPGMPGTRCIPKIANLGYRPFLPSSSSLGGGIPGSTEARPGRLRTRAFDSLARPAFAEKIARRLKRLSPEPLAGASRLPLRAGKGVELSSIRCERLPARTDQVKQPFHPKKHNVCPGARLWPLASA
jgi:hypothetical protein